jgi:methyl-branched lipid omega-hydroxylase
VTPDDIALSDPGFWARPTEERHAAFALLRRERPVSFHHEQDLNGKPGPGPGYWSLTRYDDVWAVGRQAQVFVSGQGNVIPDLPEAVRELFGSIIAMDDPRHAKLRALVNRGFTPAGIRRLGQTIETRARAVVDAIAPRGECDFVAEVAAALPLEIICDLLGIPAADRSRMLELTNQILGAGDPEFATPPEEVIAAATDLYAYARELGAHRRRTPGDDLVSQLMHVSVDGERLTDTEFGSFFILLVLAGNETTRNAISHGLVALTAHPDQRAVWLDDIDGVMPTAVDEIVRWATPVMHFRRTAACDTMIGDQAIAAGDKVVIWYISANRDEAKFDRPDELDLRRTPNDHLGFGGGPHFCLGAHVARREIAALYSELLRRLPDIEAAGPPDMLLSSLINGIKRLPCRFTPAAETVEAAARASSASTLTDGGRS